MIEALFSCCHFGKFLGGYSPAMGGSKAARMTLAVC